MEKHHTLEPVTRNDTYANPATNTVYSFYKCAWQGQYKTIKEMLDNGFPPNAVVKGIDENVAIYTLSDGFNYSILNVMDLLLDGGIDINYRTKENNSLLLHLMDLIVSFDGPEAQPGITNKFELPAIMRFKKTFDKLMHMKPSLAIGEICGEAEDIFAFAMKGRMLHWFSPHRHAFTKEESLLYETYRMAELFELV